MNFENEYEMYDRTCILSERRNWLLALRTGNGRSEFLELDKEPVETQVGKNRVVQNMFFIWMLAENIEILQPD